MHYSLRFSEYLAKRNSTHKDGEAKDLITKSLPVTLRAKKDDSDGLLTNDKSRELTWEEKRKMLPLNTQRTGALYLA